MSDHRPRIDAASHEEEIARLIAASDFRTAATLAIRAFGPEILKYLRALLQDPVAADEVFAQVGENLWRGIARFRGGSSFRTWTYRLAHNAATDYRRDAFRRRGRALESAEVAGLIDEVHSRTPYFLGAEARNGLSALKQSLDESERALLVLRLENGLPWREVAVVLSPEDRPLDEAAVRKRFERLKRKLQALVQDIERAQAE